MATLTTKGAITSYDNKVTYRELAEVIATLAKCDERALAWLTESPRGRIDVEALRKALGTVENFLLRCDSAHQ